MKLTWFGGSTFRIHIGGRMIVVDPAGAPVGIDPQELRSGAEVEIGLGEALSGMPLTDAARWQPRRAASMLDGADRPGEVLVHRAAEHAALIEAPGEPPLLLAGGQVGPVGRWAREAVVVICGADERAPELAVSVLEGLGPRLIAVAASEPAVEAVFERLREHLGGTALVALERGLALEA